MNTERKQGDKVFADVLPAIKTYIHERVISGQDFPKTYEVLADVEHCNMSLVDFLKITKEISPGAEFQFHIRLAELLWVAEEHYSGGKSA
jgi:hypothetical protein